MFDLQTWVPRGFSMVFSWEAKLSQSNMLIFDMSRHVFPYNLSIIILIKREIVPQCRTTNTGTRTATTVASIPRTVVLKYLLHMHPADFVFLSMRVPGTPRSIIARTRDLWTGLWSDILKKRPQVNQTASRLYIYKTLISSFLLFVVRYCTAWKYVKQHKYSGTVLYSYSNLSISFCFCRFLRMLSLGSGRL